MENDILNNLSEEQKALAARVLDLALFRILKNVYLELGEIEKKKMEDIMSSGNIEEIENFLKPQVKNFDDLFKTEVKKIEEEIKQRMEGN
ncbi:MAG: hypothetical protein HYT36_03780 [Candidatus Staskawiczbacteria bacterium]|nr:hypothetical protein [Candidatus Staskawiczbacteria bacterium]